MNSLTRASTYPLTAPDVPAAPRPDSTFEQLGAWRAVSASEVASLYLIRLWLLAGFIGASLLVSAIARIFDVGVGAGAEAVLRIIAGAALVWIATRRLSRIAQEVNRIGSDAGIGSEAGEPQ